MLTRLLLTLTNIFFPPLAVLLLTGPYTDTLLNCIFFLLGVLPSHIHGFYISCTYFHRKNKVRKGRYPGGPKWGIFDRRVWNGCASEGRVEELRVAGRRGKGGGRRGDGIDAVGSQSNSRKGRSRGGVEDWRSQDGYRGDGRSEMGERFGPRRSILGEMSGRH